MCWGCSADTVGEPSALQSERHSWRLSRMLLSVSRVSRDVCECFFFFSSQCFCGLIGSLVSELWCSSWPVWLTALMKRIRSDWALMLWSLLLNLSSVNPSFYLASNWIPVWGQFGLTEATLSQLFCQEKMMMTCSISSLGLLLVVIANTIIPEPEELYW